MNGDNEQLDAAQKREILAVFNNQPAIELEIDKALREEYDNAERIYSNWKELFTCTSISAINNEIVICMEEKESLYHFNIFFKNCRAVGVSIDD